ncbi:TPA: hypothetical protein HMV63_23150 [Escherichia coli]|nr:hypothetical protein [Escherichia coli]
MWEFTFPASPDVLRAATYLVSRNTASVFRYRGSGRTATTGEVFLVRAVSRGISQPLTHRLSLRAGALIRSVHVLYRNGHRGSWRVTADFTHQRSCICTLIQNASQRSVTGEIYSLRLFWQILYVTL